jgi:hypothetical protein
VQLHALRCLQEHHSLGTCCTAMLLWKQDNQPEQQQQLSNATPDSKLFLAVQVAWIRQAV